MMKDNKYALAAALKGVISALIFAVAFIVQIPVPATGGYIDFGDAMIFMSALETRRTRDFTVRNWN